MPIDNKKWSYKDYVGDHMPTVNYQMEVICKNDKDDETRTVTTDSGNSMGACANLNSPDQPRP